MLAAVLGRARIDLAPEVPTERFLRTKSSLLGNPLQRPIGGFQQLAGVGDALADQPVDRRQAGGLQELPLQGALAEGRLLGEAAANAVRAGCGASTPSALPAAWARHAEWRG